MNEVDQCLVCSEKFGICVTHLCKLKPLLTYEEHQDNAYKKLQEQNKRLSKLLMQTSMKLYNLQMKHNELNFDLPLDDGFSFVPDNEDFY